MIVALVVEYVTNGLHMLFRNSSLLIDEAFRWPGRVFLCSLMEIAGPASAVVSWAVTA